MNKRSNPVAAFLRGKGFYLVMTVCILTAAGCSFAAIRNMMDELEQNASSAPQTGEDQWITQPPLELPDTPVEQKTENVPVPTPAATPAAPEQTSPPSSSSQPTPESASSASSGSGEPAAAPAPSFARPVPGQTLQAFSGDELIYSETLGDWRTHNGADLAANLGDTVQCAAAGEVVTAQEDARWGGVVEVKCGDVTVRYAGLALPLTVSEGQQLAAGQAVGQVGEIPCESAQASHLHLEVLQEDSYLDPIAWMEQAG